jgi:hypothetical protein
MDGDEFGSVNGMNEFVGEAGALEGILSRVCVYIYIYYLIQMYSVLWHSYSSAQAFSRRLTTAVSEVRDRAKSCGVCGEQSGTGTVIFRVLQFLPSIIHSSNFFTIITNYHPALVQLVHSWPQ